MTATQEVRAGLGRTASIPGLRAAAGYLALQAGLGLLWWIGLAALPTLRARFELDAGHPATLVAYLPADLAVFVIGSGLGSYGLVHDRRWTALVVAATAGGTAYATLRLAGWVAAGGAGGWGIAPMAVATLATAAIAVGVHRDELGRSHR